MNYEVTIDKTMSIKLPKKIGKGAWILFCMYYHFDTIFDMHFAYR